MVVSLISGLVSSTEFGPEVRERQWVPNAGSNRDLVGRRGALRSSQVYASKLLIPLNREVLLKLALLKSNSHSFNQKLIYSPPRVGSSHHPISCCFCKSPVFLKPSFLNLV